MYEDTYALAEAMAAAEDLRFGYKPDNSYIEIFAGSSAPLHQAVLGFCSKDRAFVKADPGYRSRRAGSQVRRRPGSQCAPAQGHLGP